MGRLKSFWQTVSYFIHFVSQLILLFLAAALFRAFDYG